VAQALRPATVPICDVCWLIEEPGREPVRLTEAGDITETCYRCKRETRSGIYVRRMIETPTDERD
jgi:hypothetical protein